MRGRKAPSRSVPGSGAASEIGGHAIAEPTTVPAACPDLEDIAALLDGKLTARERARLTEHLAGCESCYETFAGTARILEDSREEQLLAAAARPFERPRAARARQPRTWWAAAALAAVLAATVGLVVFLQASRGDGPSTAGLASLVGGSETASKVPWTGRVYRGGSEPPDLPSEREAFRLGVRLLDLHLALEGDNRGGAEETLRMLHNLLLDRMVLPSPEMAGAYDELGKKMKPGIAPHVLLGDAAALEKKAVEELQEEPRFVELGRWTEACRLAAVGGRPDLFRKRATLRVLDQAVAPGGKDAGTLDPQAIQILRDVRGKIAGGRIDVADLGRQCSELLMQLDSD
jgi:Putative zinc-finger